MVCQQRVDGRIINGIHAGASMVDMYERRSFVATSGQYSLQFAHVAFASLTSGKINLVTF